MTTDWLITSAGLAGAAAGLYLLIARRRSGLGWPARIGAGLVFLASAAVAQEVFQPTGTFLGLLAFLSATAGALCCLITVAALHSPAHSLLAFAAAGACIAGLLLFSGSVIVPTMVVLLACGPAAFGALRLNARGRAPQAPDGDGAAVHEPLWGCVAWAALLFGLLHCLRGDGATPAAALLNNQLLAGSVVLATGVLTLMVRRALLWSVLGLGAATLGLVLLLSAFGRFHAGEGADVLAVVILGGAAVHAAALLSLDAHHDSGRAEQRLPEGTGGA
jgi:hypothetical protein